MAGKRPRTGQARRWSDARERVNSEDRDGLSPFPTHKGRKSPLVHLELVGYVSRAKGNAVISTADLIHEAESLPVEQRALVVDALLRTLNPPDPEIDRKWADLALRRLEELRSGKVKPVPGETVFAEIRKRFA